MLTSESHNREILRFFDEHRKELGMRLVGILKNRYRRTILSMLKKGVDIPPVWGMLKLQEVTLYMLPIGIKEVKGNLQITSFSSFMIMKDLREQKPIMVTDSQPHAIIYSSHAIRRYKERINLAPETEFVDVCKHMFVNGCSRPKAFGDMSQIYGSDEDNRELSLIVLNGVYLGYASGKTEVLHAETYLSTSELREDQEYLDANKSECLAQWKRLQQALAKGEINTEQFRAQLKEMSPRIAVKEGKYVELSPEEAKKRDEENRKKIQDPEYRAQSVEHNRKKFENKMTRKGYK